MSFHAFVDESFADSYIVAAAVVPAADVNPVRAAIRGVLRPGQRRIHFKDERDQRKDSVLTAIAAAGISARVYVASNDRQARGLCLARMVPDLAAADVTRLVLERDDSLLRFDQRTLDDLKRKHCPDLYYAHLRAHADLLLCLPDAIAWCWAKGGQWRDRVAGFATEIRV